jgi:O6-methylguanine-DNA--protein-cysteine methyltransferase
MPTRRTRDRPPSSPSSSEEEEEEEEDYKVVTKKKQKMTKPSREEEEEEETTSGTEPFRKDFYNAVYTTVKTIPEGKVNRGLFSLSSRRQY